MVANPHRTIYVEYSVIDRYARKLRVGFEARPDVDIVPQLFAFMNILHNRNDTNHFQSLQAFILKGRQIMARRVVWEVDPAAQSDLSRFISEHSDECSIHPRHG